MENKEQLYIEKMKVLEELAEFYSNIISNSAMFLHIHHFDQSEENIQKSEELRAKIAILTEQINQDESEQKMNAEYELCKSAWDTISVIKKLQEAAHILLHEKDYDGHGWEEIEICYKRSTDIIQEMEDFARQSQQAEQTVTDGEIEKDLMEIFNNNSSDANNGQMSVITEDSYSDTIDEIIG